MHPNDEPMLALLAMAEGMIKRFSIELPPSQAEALMGHALLSAMPDWRREEIWEQFVFRHPTAALSRFEYKKPEPPLRLVDMVHLWVYALLDNHPEEGSYRAVLQSWGADGTSARLNVVSEFMIWHRRLIDAVTRVKSEGSQGDQTPEQERSDASGRDPSALSQETQIGPGDTGPAGSGGLPA